MRSGGGVFVSRSFSEPWPKTLGELQGQQNVVLQKPSSTYQVFRANSTFCVDQACTFRCVPTGSYYHEIEMVFHLHFKSGASSSCSRQKCQPCLVKIHIFTLCNFCQRRPKKRGMIFASVLGTRLKDRLITLEFSLKYFRDAGRGQGGGSWLIPCDFIKQSTETCQLSFYFLFMQALVGLLVSHY